MKVRELFDKFISNFNSIYIFENDNRVEDFSDDENSYVDITLQCVKKYGDRVVSDWYCDCLSNSININIE